MTDEEAKEERQRNTLLNKTSASKLSIEQEEADMVVTSMEEANGLPEEKEAIKYIYTFVACTLHKDEAKSLFLENVEMKPLLLKEC